MTFLGTLITILVAANAFFIIRIIDKIEQTSEIVWQLRQEIVLLKVSFETYTHKKIGE